MIESYKHHLYTVQQQRDYRYGERNRLFHGLAEGTTTVTASAEGLNGTAHATVNALLSYSSNLAKISETKEDTKGIN